ncbi:DUF2268 domain-containing putative Zn-dependent protease [Oceanobacillus sp. CAU 1775]
MLQVKQLTPQRLLDNQHRLDDFLEEELSFLVSENTWMTEWRQVVGRFQLQKFEHLSSEEILAFNWNEDEIQKLIEKTFTDIESQINFQNLHITIVPALKFPWFENLDNAIWTNGFTNGLENIIIAIPARPDSDFLQYLIAHESHHALIRNPIYDLNLENFTLEEWYKMEGIAEYFSLSLYPDKRWWKDSFTKETEKNYWKVCKEHMKTVDDQVKGRLCFGDASQGIPTFAGYSFAYNMVAAYVKSNPIGNINDLFEVEASAFIENYRLKETTV